MPNQYSGVEWLDAHGNLRCTACKEYKPLTEFHKDKSRKPWGVGYQCKVCAIANSRRHHRRRMKEDPAYRKAKRDSYVRGVWGMSAEEYEAAWKAQGVCAICKTPLLGAQQTHLDHDHATDKRREFLCTNCNRGLGHFQDSISNLEAAAAYLRKHAHSADSGEEGSSP